MPKIVILDYQDKYCINLNVIGGYLIFKKDGNYYIRKDGFPLMVCLKFSSYNKLAKHIDAEGNKYLKQNREDLKRIRSYPQEFWCKDAR